MLQPRSCTHFPFWWTYCWTQPWLGVLPIAQPQLDPDICRVCNLLNPFLSNSCIQGCSASADIWRNTHCRLDPRPSDLREFWNPAACCIKGTATGFLVALKPYPSRVHLGCVCVCVCLAPFARPSHLRSQLKHQNVFQQTLHSCSNEN